MKLTYTKNRIFPEEGELQSTLSQNVAAGEYSVTFGEKTKINKKFVWNLLFSYLNSDFIECHYNVVGLSFYLWNIVLFSLHYWMIATKVFS